MVNSKKLIFYNNCAEKRDVLLFCVGSGSSRTPAVYLRDMYPWYREVPLSVGQICSPLTAGAATATATIKTEAGYSDCMLDFHSKVSPVVRLKWS